MSFSGTRLTPTWVAGWMCFVIRSACQVQARLLICFSFLSYIFFFVPNYFRERGNKRKPDIRLHHGGCFLFGTTICPCLVENVARQETSPLVYVQGGIKCMNDGWCRLARRCSITPICPATKERRAGNIQKILLMLRQRASLKKSATGKEPLAR